MCVQCIAGGMAAGTVATGSRWWLVAHFQGWLTPRRRRVLSAVLIGAGVLTGGLVGPTP